MEHLREAAYSCIYRACGFAALAIFCMLIGMSHDSLAMLRCGGVLTTLTGLVLYLKARNAPVRDHRRTEMWLYIPKDRRPPASLAQWAVGNVLQEAYSHAAQWAFGFAIAFWSLSLLVSAGRRLGFLTAAPNW